MTYVLTTKTTTGTIEGYDQVNEILGDVEPDGLIARYAGDDGDGLVVVTVWASKAHSDRFGAEHLFPAFRKAFGEVPSTGPEVAIGFEAHDAVTVG